MGHGLSPPAGFGWAVYIEVKTTVSLVDHGDEIKLICIESPDCMHALQTMFGLK